MNTLFSNIHSTQTNKQTNNFIKKDWLTFNGIARSKGKMYTSRMICFCMHCCVFARFFHVHFYISFDAGAYERCRTHNHSSVFTLISIDKIPFGRINWNWNWTATTKRGRAKKRVMPTSNVYTFGFVIFLVFAVLNGTQSSRNLYLFRKIADACNKS